ncbi:glycosyltransferase family 9 protein [Siphonobacter sp.]|uniref:glycosyltransferase family 9 protein n=1 Tax=Siphonobacter sp. TaxID=1869184 RepID=UPI003B3B4282
MKILVIQTAFIGDAILATSLLEKLHHHYPQAEIDFLVRRGNESLLKNHPYLHETLIWDKKEGKYASLWKLLRHIRSRQYTYVINVQRFATTGFLTAFSGAETTVGFDKNPLSFLFTRKIKHRFDGPHEVERNTDLVAWFTDEHVFRPRLYPPKLNFPPQTPYVCLAPSSVWFTKQYPEEKWIDLIQQLPDSLHVYLLGGPGDKDLTERIRQAAGRSQVHNLAGTLSLLESAALMQGAVMNYVNDSGPMHLCSAVNAPTAAIFCSTVPTFGFGPLSDQSQVVEVQESLTCRPCGIHGYKSCPQGHFKCARDIRTEQLLDALPA